MNQKLKIKTNHNEVRVICDRHSKINPRELEALKKKEVADLFVPVAVDTGKKLEVCYDVTGYIPLMEFVTRGIKKKEYIRIIQSFVNLNNSFKERLLQLSNCILSLRYIYIQPGNFKIKYIYVPIVYSETKDYSFNYLRTLPFYCVFTNSEKHDYVKKYIEYFNNLISFSMYEFTQMLEKINGVNEDVNGSSCHLVNALTNEKTAVIGEEFLVGKDSSSDLILSSKHASRRHAKIIFYNRNFYVQDCNSTNHTYVNGNKVEPGANIRLNNGDIIRFADANYMFSFGTGGK